MEDQKTQIDQKDQKDVHDQIINGMIYRIWNDVDDKTYIGSTSQAYLSYRMKNHKNSMKASKTKYYNMKLYKHMRALGFEKFHIELIEKVQVKSKRELKRIEGMWQRKLKPELNYEIAGRTQKEWEAETGYSKKYYTEHKDDFKEKAKQYAVEHKDEIKETSAKYYTKHKDTIIEKTRKYYTENKEKVLESCKQYRLNHKREKSDRDKAYRENNKEQVRAKKKEYREMNKDKIAQREQVDVKCECGDTVRKYKLNRHRLTKRHQARINDSEPSTVAIPS